MTATGERTPKLRLRGSGSWSRAEDIIVEALAKAYLDTDPRVQPALEALAFLGTELERMHGLYMGKVAENR